MPACLLPASSTGSRSRNPTAGIVCIPSGWCGLPFVSPSVAPTSDAVLCSATMKAPRCAMIAGGQVDCPRALRLVDDADAASTTESNIGGAHCIAADILGLSKSCAMRASSTCSARARRSPVRRAEDATSRASRPACTYLAVRECSSALPPVACYPGLETACLPLEVRRRRAGEGVPPSHSIC